MYNVQPEIEVLAKAVLLNFLSQILVRRCNDPNVYGHGPPAADPFHLAFLQNTKQFSLSSETQVADLIQEQCSTIGRLNASNSPLDTRGNAFLDPEEFTFNQGIRQCCAIDGHEWFSATSAHVMNRSRR